MPEQRKKHKSLKQRKHRKQSGGDASAWAQSVYGQAGTHTAAHGAGNVIAANNLSGVNMCSGGVAANAAPVTGGRRKLKGGKGILTDVAVPAILLYANQVIKPRKTMVKKSKKNFSRKLRRY